jgi:multisite-specific tRNA:(cytosine-C5)-methyltransferase
MFPSGKGTMDSCTVGGNDEVNIDVVDAEMDESGDVIKGKQETNIATNGSTNDANANGEEIKRDESESGKGPRRSEPSDSTSIRTEHSSLPLHHCMRIVPHDQNSGGFFIAVLHKLSPLNGIFSSI